MKTSATLVLAASVLASAQVVYNSTTGQYLCSRPNSAFCAGDSFGTDIIIRCDANALGQPGRCTNNLAGQFPLGVQPALCWQSQPQAGDAACEKNCIVYASQPFQLPSSVCTPYATASGTGAGPTVTFPVGPPRPSVSNGTISRTTARFPSSVRLPSTTRLPSSAPRPTGTGGAPSFSGNGTAPSTRGASSGSLSATRTPISPSSSFGPVTVSTAGAVQNAAGYLAVAGIVAAYLA
ncbi:hypothetical protein LY78DRAFT_570046 [Colletotrichum sublineola]|uniref:Uncharacterized protein n=1 Tax=Colletotrichum sublineola TaxID=1173701 RepID=A0A066WXJ2_COLSU|nr:hypothetical protein LY78DRAFT_570046 [Colletotrichum sublineola]KDN60134.1 hypothetical protein CSUB01_02793 [Colletotrichum sublineola]